ncbi:hypothetical protein M0812_01625 [Anaeramoeba flamelloides]|uniref:PAS domain-containing protein n=1 Tax=Anaeramoeba flamelloides TaxID=1746091 RepID=A0AAV7Z318_9EUKA|nr:hypothetical protein M0812_01625 [Anaeramoeba flamelloides]
MGNTEAKKLTAKKFRSYKKLCNRSNEAIVLLDELSQFIYANKAGATLFGLKKTNEILSYTPGFFSPQSQPHLKLNSDKAAKNIVGQVFKSKDGKIDFIWQHKTTKGKLFFAHIYLTMIKVDEKSICQAIMRKTVDPRLSQESSDNPIDPRLLNVDASSEGISSENQNSKKASSEEKKSNSNTTQVSFIDIGEIDLDKEFRNFSEEIKQIVRANNDPTTERKVIESIQNFTKLFETGLQARDKVIVDLTERSSRQRKEGKTRYRELENHLQSKLVVLEKMKKDHDKYRDQSQKMKIIVDQVKKNFEKQKKIDRNIKKLYSTLEEPEQK